VTTHTANGSIRSRKSNGEGSLQKWRDGFRIDVRVGGKRFTVYGKTKQEVRAKRDALQRQVEDGFAPTTGRLTVEEFLNDWLAHQATTTEQGRGKRPSTIAFYEEKARNYIIPAIGKRRLRDLSAVAVDQMLSKIDRSPQTVKHVRTVLINALSYAERKRLVPRNVAKNSEPIRVKEFEAYVLTEDQARAFLEAAHGERLEALYIVAVPLGLRQGELLGLRWNDINLETREVAIRSTAQRIKNKGIVVLDGTKWESDRKAVLPHGMIEMLKAHKAVQNKERLLAGTNWIANDLVFTTTTGTPIAASWLVGGSFHRICGKAGIPYSTQTRHGLRFHDLRHSAATMLFAMGLDHRTVMAILGHSSYAMMKKYIHMTPAILTEVADKLDAVYFPRASD